MLEAVAWGVLAYALTAVRIELPGPVTFHTDLTEVAMLGSVLFRHAGRLGTLGLYSLATGIASLCFLGLMSAGNVSHVGLHERLASGILSLWVLVTALRLLVAGDEAEA